MSKRQIYRENMLEVLMYLFENHMQNNCHINISVDKLAIELQQIGFKNETIQRALNWLTNLAVQQHSITNNPPQATSIRIFSEEECQKMDKKCRSLILNLEQANILTSRTRELVITQLMQLDRERIDLAQVKWVTLMVLFNQPDQKQALLQMEQLILTEGLEKLNA